MHIYNYIQVCFSQTTHYKIIKTHYYKMRVEIQV